MFWQNAPHHSEGLLILHLAVSVATNEWTGTNYDNVDVKI